GSKAAIMSGTTNCRSGEVLGVAFFFSSRRRHTRFSRDWSSDVCSSDLHGLGEIVSEKLSSNGLLDLVVGTGYGATLAIMRGNGEIGRASCRERVKIAVLGALHDRRWTSVVLCESPCAHLPPSQTGPAGA